MPDESPQDWDALAHRLLAISDLELPPWIAAHRADLRIELIQALKRYGDAQQALQDPRRGDLATRYALHLAEAMPTEPLALALARWARGNWAMLHTPHEAITLYQQALASYQLAGDRFSVARLYGNLVYVLADCGRFGEAEQAYTAAYPIFFARINSEPLYLLRLEQNYGLLLHTQGRYVEALASHARAEKLAVDNNYPVIASEIQVNLALTLVMLGRLAEAEQAYLRGRMTAVAHEQTMTIARIDMNLGELYAALGQPADALRKFQAAHTAFTNLANHMEVGSVLMRQGALFQRIGAWRAARHCYHLAQAEFAQQQMAPQVGQALVYHAIMCRRSGDYQLSLTLLTEAEALWQRLEQPLWLTLIHFERVALALAQQEIDKARVLLQLSLPLTDHAALNAQQDYWLAETMRLTAVYPIQYEEARLAYLRSLTYAQKQNDRWLQRQVLAGLGQLLLPVDADIACQWLEEALVLDEQIRQSLSVEELKAGFHAETDDLLPLLVRFAVEQRLVELALAYVWRAKGSAFLDLVTAIAVDKRLLPEQSAELMQTRQALAYRRWQQAQAVAQPMPDALRENQDPLLRELEEKLFALRQRRNMPTSQKLLFSTPRTALAEMDADFLLEYVRCGDDLLGIAVDRQGNYHAAWLIDLDTLADLLDQVQLDFQNIVTQPVERLTRYGEQWQEQSLPLLQECYDRLIAPLLVPLMPASTQPRLLIAPCYPLSLLPFAAFWDGQHYLVERYTLETIPSGAFLTIPAVSKTTTGQPFIIAASAADALPEAAKEALMIGEIFAESQLFVDQPGAVAHLLQSEYAPRFLHIVAHTILRTDAPILSALQLTEELLSVEQCYELNLAGTELVTLSSCGTAAGMESGGALLAFQTALFVAGAQRVLTSLWPIQDEATGAWMGHFYRLLALGSPPPVALRQTQLHLLNHPAYRHPACWAAFTCSRR